MRTAMEDLGLDHLWVVYPDERSYPLASGLTVVPARPVSGGFLFRSVGWVSVIVPKQFVQSRSLPKMEAALAGRCFDVYSYGEQLGTASGKGVSLWLKASSLTLFPAGKGFWRPEGG